MLKPTSWRIEGEKGAENHENFFLCGDTNTLFTKLSEGTSEWEGT